MPEINLLPGELRGKEEKELETAHKIPRVVKIEMSKPAKKEGPGPSFLRRLFSRQPKKSSPATPKEQLKEPWPEEKAAFLAKPQPRLSAKPSFLSRLKMGFKRWPAQKSKEKKLPVLPPETKKNGFKAVNNKPVSPLPPAEFLKVRPEKHWFFRRPKAAGKGNGQKPKAAAVFSGNLPAPKKPPATKKEEKLKASLRAIKRPAVFGVNLLLRAVGRGEEPEIIKKIFFIAGAGVLAALLAGGAYLGIGGYQFFIERQAEEVKTEIIALDEEIAGLEKIKIAAQDLQQQFRTISDLLAKHVYWTKFFELLEKNTVSDVSYTNFAMAGRQELVISARGRDYKSVARQLLAFQQAKDFVKSVRIDSASAEIDPQKGLYQGVKFNVSLEFLPDVFIGPQP